MRPADRPPPEPTTQTRIGRLFYSARYAGWRPGHIRLSMPLAHMTIWGSSRSLDVQLRPVSLDPLFDVCPSPYLSVKQLVVRCWPVRPRRVRRCGRHSAHPSLGRSEWLLRRPSTVGDDRRRRQCAGHRRRTRDRSIVRPTRRASPSALACRRTRRGDHYRSAARRHGRTLAQLGDRRHRLAVGMARTPPTPHRSMGLRPCRLPTRNNQSPRAGDQALYPATMSRLRTQVQLHHAAALVRGGHIPGGLSQAADLLDRLPEEQHNERLRTVARQIIGAVPATERGRPMYRELTDRMIAEHREG